MRAYIALFCVCIFWGGTYLAIRVGVRTFTPPMLMSLRYIISGGVLLIGALYMKVPLPRPREMLLTALFGGITIGMGNGSLVYAEQWMPSGLAALMVSVQPFWMVGLEAVLPRGERLHLPTTIGMLVGLAGVVFLVAPSAMGTDGSSELSRASLLSGFFLLQFGAAMWSIGSIAQRRLRTRAHPIVSGAIQQLATGLVFGIPALLDPRRPHWTATGISALAYLAIFGGLVGYSSYIYVMDRLPIAVASTYTYVNPAVAVLLGWLFLAEPLHSTEMIAMVVILVGVAIVKWASSNRPLPIPAPE